MASFSVKGKIYFISGITTVGPNALQKRELVLEVVDNPQYPDFLTFDMIKDGVNLVNGYQPGQEVEVHFNLRGRAYQDKTTHQTKFMNNLGLWKINPVQPAYQAPPAQQYYQQAPPAPAPQYQQPPVQNQYPPQGPPPPQYQQQAPAPQYQQAPPQYAQPAPQAAPPQYQQAPAPAAFNRDPDSDLPF